MLHQSIKPRTRKFIKRPKNVDFCNLRKIYQTNIEKKLFDTATKTRPDDLKSAFKKVVDKAAEATGEFIGKKIANKNVKTKTVHNENYRNAEELGIPPLKRGELLNELRQVL